MVVRQCRRNAAECARIRLKRFCGRRSVIAAAGSDCGCFAGRWQVGQKVPLTPSASRFADSMIDSPAFLAPPSPPYDRLSRFLPDDRDRALLGFIGERSLPSSMVRAMMAASPLLPPRSPASPRFR